MILSIYLKGLDKLETAGTGKQIYMKLHIRQADIME